MQIQKVEMNFNINGKDVHGVFTKIQISENPTRWRIASEELFDKYRIRKVLNDS